MDLVVDPLFGIPAAAAVRVLRPHGRLVNLGGSAGEIAPIDSSTLRSRSLRVLGYTNNELTPEQRAGALAHVVDEVLAGRLTVAHEPVPLVDVTGVWDQRRAGDRDRSRCPEEAAVTALRCCRRRWSAATPSPSG